MATMTTDRLVADYLERLEGAARHLPVDRRSELVLEIREHIDHALSETGTEDELAVRNALERLGPPEAIVAEASPPAAPVPPESRRLEIAALIALVVPFIGWLIGAVLVVMSRAWSNREKALGLALLALALLLPAFGLVAEREGSPQVPVGTPEVPPPSEPGAAEGVAIVVLLLAGVPAAMFLGWRLSLRRGTR